MNIKDIMKINERVFKVADVSSLNSNSRPHVRISLDYNELATNKGKTQLVYLIAARDAVIKAGYATCAN